MKPWNSFLSAVGVVLAASIIAGCSSNGTSAAFAPPAPAVAAGHGTASTSAASLLAMTTVAKITTLRQAQHMQTSVASPLGCVEGKDWLWCQYWQFDGCPPYCTNPVMYISDDYDIYEYGKTLQTIGDNNQPYGECVDAKGDTWITNFSGGTVVEYTHGGTQPIATLGTDGYSIGCSVSPNGDLAVANFSTASGIGNVQVFKHASGTPTNYSSQSAPYLWPPGYDAQGNLFVEAETASGGVGVFGLPAGGSSLDPTPVPWTINVPGSVMWDGKYITFTDQEAGGPSANATTIYQARETKSGLVPAGTTTLQDTCSGSQVDVVQPFIVGKKNTPVNKRQGALVIGGNLYCQNRLDAWKYPAGGQPVGIAGPAPQYAYGQAVSGREK